MSALRPENFDRNVAAHGFEVSSSSLVDRPVVSVLVHTFNHSGFIEDCISSVLGQQVDFPIEIVIADDCSTDGSESLLREMQARHPERIRLLLAKQNLGGAGEVNARRLLESARGVFAAWLDGDDYWSSTKKLEMQLRRLRKCTNAVACATSGFVETKAGSIDARFVFTEGAISVQDILPWNSILMSSVMYRTDFLRTLDPGLIDWAWHVQAALVAPIEVVTQLTTVYRAHGGGLWTSMSESEQRAENVALYERQILPLLSDTGDSDLERFGESVVDGARSLAVLADAASRADSRSANAALGALSTIRPCHRYQWWKGAQLLSNANLWGEQQDEFVRDAIGRWPGFSDFHRLLGVEELKAGRVDDAVSSFQTAFVYAVEGSWLQTMLLVDLARAHRLLRNAELSTRLAQAALLKNPDFVPAQRLLE